MEQKTVDREKLTAYLLGRLPVEEQDALAEQYFTDDELFDRLLEVKADLMDQYARGQLPAADRPQLESYLDKQPDGWRELAVARALTKVIDAEDTAGKPETIRPVAVSPAPEPVGWRQMLVDWVARPVPALAMATGLIVLGSLLTWLILRNWQLNHDKEQLLAQMQQRDARQEQTQRETERKLAEVEARATQSEMELQEREKQLREVQASFQSPAVASPMIPWLMSSASLRGPGQPPDTVRLDPKAKTIALTIPVRGNQRYTGYEVELKTEDGNKQILWKDSQPYTPPIRRGENVIFHRPAKEFAQTSYKLTLTLISAGQPKTRDYYFTVVKQ
ncbi:MAG: hypothetical protein ACREEM_02005 [Blastocatellia bacterium]